MTLFISAIGVIGRLVGAALTSTLGWASSLLFGRVPRSHQIFVILMLSGSLLWMALIVIALVSRAPDVVLGVAAVPLVVGAAAYLVPDDEDRPTGLGIVVELLRGYLLAPSSEFAAGLAKIDATLLDLETPTEDWEILYRLRLRAERDALAGIDLAGGRAAAAEATAARQAAASDPGPAAIGEARTADG